jgi:hypothetical protein
LKQGFAARKVKTNTVGETPIPEIKEKIKDEEADRSIPGLRRLLPRAKCSKGRR